MGDRDAATGKTAFAETVSAEIAGASKPDAEPAAVGKDRYATTRAIGEGGMGRVLEAVDRQFSRSVALKQLRPDRVSAAARERFATEALVTGNLEHPGVPPVYERGALLDGAPFYTMRLIRGRTLTEAIAEGAGLAGRLRLLPVLVKIAHTIAFAHDRGVVHRDLKPDNVVLGRYGEAVVLDWGIAKVRGIPTHEGNDGAIHASGAGTSSQTAHGSVLGTPSYMAPEQARGETDRVDERTDVFALGALLYQVLTGRAPYLAPTVGDVLALAREGRFEPVASIEQKAPAALVAICAKAMARAPEDRYQGAAEMAEALEALEAEALAGGSGAGVRRTVNAVLGVLIAGATAGLASVWMSVASLRDLGTGAIFILLFGATGAALGATEIATRGRHRLAPLVLAIALAVLCGGIQQAASGLDRVVSRGRDLLDDPGKLKWLLLEGTHESIGSLIVSAQIAAVLLLLWGAGLRSRRAPE